MEAHFWIESWNIGGSKTSFHRPDVHPYVLKHLPPEKLHGKRILVPLCGKAVDMDYFRRHAAHVVGVELVEKAIYQFFEEQRLPFRRDEQRFDAEGITLWCQDFFTLTPHQIGRIDLIYDRAALVALPWSMRQSYIRQISELLPVGGQQFIPNIS